VLTNIQTDRRETRLNTLPHASGYKAGVGNKTWTDVKLLL